MPTFMKGLQRGAPKHNVHSFSSKFATIIFHGVAHNCFKNYRFLQEVGYEDIFNNNEVNEIKDLYDRAQAELTESINQANSLHT